MSFFSSKSTVCKNNLIIIFKSESDFHLLKLETSRIYDVAI